MRNALALGTLALACLLPWVGAPAAPPENKPAPPTALVILLTDDGPLVVGLDMQIDGKPVQQAFESARAALLEKLFVWLDRNNDGGLDTTEAARLPMSLVSLPGLRPGELEAVNIAYNFDALDFDGNGEVSKVELRDFLSEFGMNPLAVSVDMPVVSVPVNLQPQFFKALDANGDGKLSAQELDVGAKFIAKNDADEDDRLDIAEATGARPAPNTDLQFAVEVMQRPRTPAPIPTRVVVVEAERPPGSIGSLLLAHYRPGNQPRNAEGLTAKQIGLTAARFKQLDVDKDGLVSAHELDRLPELPPDCVLAVRLGKRDEKAALLEATKKNPSVKVTKTGEFAVSGALWVEGRALPGAIDESVVGNLARSYKLEFDAADRDSNGKIDAAERKRSRLFSTIGDAVDRDGDGMIETKEVTAWVDEIVKPLAQVLMNRASLVVSQQGNGLWDLLDVNRDGFLSERELRRAAGLFKELDRNGDGALAADELPSAHQVTLARGEATLSSRGQFVRLDLAPDGRLTYPSRQDIGGPTWFRKMDRNGDGDVSHKEFLGTPEQFRKMDRDNDGLISLEEAEAK